MQERDQETQLCLVLQACKQEMTNNLLKVVNKDQACNLVKYNQLLDCIVEIDNNMHWLVL